MNQAPLVSPAHSKNQKKKKERNPPTIKQQTPTRVQKIHFQKFSHFHRPLTALQKSHARVSR